MNQHSYAGIVRLKDGATPQQLQAQLEQRQQQFPTLYPKVYSQKFFDGTGFTPMVAPLRDHVLNGMARTLWILFAAVGLVLVIACAHVANLLLVRMEARRRDVTVRAALGATRTDFAWHFLSESLMLTAIAAVLGLALAAVGIRALLAVGPAALPRIEAIHLGGTAVAFALGVAAAIGVTFGLLPLYRARVDTEALREGARGLTASRGRNLVRNGLVVAQVAMSVVLLAAGGLMLQSAWRLRAISPGFQPRNVLTFRVPLPYATYGWNDYGKVAALHHELQRRLGALPGVQSLGGVEGLPMEGAWGCSTIFFEQPSPNGEPVQACLPNAPVAPGYFATMQIPLVAGRAPDWTEVEQGHAGVVVSRALAEHFWPGQDPIGQGLRGNGREPPYYRVVGVAGDVKGDGLEKPPTEIVYFPMVPIAGSGLWGAARELSVVVRTSGDPTGIVAAARGIMRELDPSIPLDEVRTMRDVMAASLARSTLAMLLLSIAATMALLLSAIGIYGVISYLVGQRRSEIGIRLALGARTEQVRRSVVLGALRLAALGVVIGSPPRCLRRACSDRSSSR